MHLRSRQLFVSLLALVTGLALALGLAAPVTAAVPDPVAPGGAQKGAEKKVDKAAGQGSAADPTSKQRKAPSAAAAADEPDLSKFQKVVLGQGTGLGEVMELTVADDGRVFFITRAGDISMYDPADGSIEIIMNNPSLGVWSGLEDGGLGITLDPDFATNNWIYVYYAPLPATHNANRLSRLTVETDGGETSIAKSSEKVILEVGTQRNVCCHSAGSLQFGDGGVLHLATGDNTSSSDNDGYSPHDERPGRSDYDAQKSSANTNDLRGKILRVIPRNDDAGDVDPTAGDGISYDIPGGNLFGEGGAYPSALYPDADPAKTRPEIFVMGLRNPYRLGVDADTDALYWGEVGPDSRVNSPNRGPRHFEEFNRTEVAMNGGWPYCGGEVGDDLTKMDFGGAYVDWDFVANRYRTNSDGTPKRFPCNDPDEMAGVNDSPNSTGLQTLPPMTDAWIPYSDVAPYKYPAVQGATPTGGQVYRQSQNTAAKDTAFPAHYEGSYFMSEMSRGWIKEVRMDAAGNIESINDFMSGFVAPGDLEFGPDGSMYVLEYGTGFFSGSPQTKLVRIDYAINGSAPVAKAAADVTEGDAPLDVQFTSDGTTDPDGDDVTYAWDLDGDGETDSTEADPSFTYDEVGDYTVLLTVTDATGKSATAQVVVTVGNTAPQVSIELPADGGFYAPGDDVPFTIDVQDAEETVDCSEVVLQAGLGHDVHVHPNLSVNGCDGVIRMSTAADHGPDANTYGVLIATYADQGANDGANASLSGSDTVILQPKLRQAEHATGRQGVGQTGYDDKSGTRPGGGSLITGMGNGDWVMFDPMSLVAMTDVSIRYSGGPQSGATVQVRAGAANGPVVATVPLDGGTQGQYFYKTVSAEITARDADAGGRPLYFVYSGNGEMNFDEFRVDGTGVASNTSPVITSATATPADGLAPLEVDFAVEAEDPDGDDLTYAWDFGVEGDDDTADSATAAWTYAEPGTYTATVTVEDATGKTTSRTVEVNVRQPCATAPTPDEGYELLFDGTDLSSWTQAGPGGFTVENCALTSVGGLGMLWYSERSFADHVVKLQFKLSDDGDNSGVFMRFPDPGTDPNVAIDEGHEIQIKEGQPNDEPQKTGSVYNFDREDARNANPPGEWNDYEIRVVGQTYTMTLNGEVVNRYTSDGSRGTEGYIGLQNHGANDSVTFRNIQVRELDVDEPFIDSLTADPVRGAAPLEVDFTAAGVDRQDEEITYEWDFGDGSDVVTGAGEVSHTYTEGGAFTASVTPVDSAGNRGETRETEEITVLVDPVATATAAPRCGVLPLEVDFDASATDPQDQTVSWEWDFGVDGTDEDTSTEQSPTWTYTEAGEYVATLTATDPDGNTGTSSVRIEVLADGECRPVADLSELFNNDGISTDANPGDGNFDGGGWTFAAELLPQAVLPDGGPVRINDVDYDFGSPADGQLNNVEADGQVITLPTGTYDELSILATAHNGDVQANATLAYNDGTTAQAPLRFTDWAVSPKFGEEIAIDMPYRHNGGGDTSPRVMIFTQRIALEAGKQPDTLTLPTNPNLHVFAVSGVRAEDPAPPCEQPERSDEFNDSDLLDNCHWTVRRPDETAYDVSDGALHLTARPGEYNDTPNVITQAAPDGEWTATTKITWDPTEAGQQAGLVVAGTGGSGFAKMTFVDKGNDNEWIEFLKSSSPSNDDFEFSGNWNTGGGSFDGPFLPGDFPTTFWLRFTSDGTQLRGSYSTDGEEFVQVGDARTLAGITNPRVGVMALKGGASGDPVADFDFFRWSQEQQGEAPTVTATADPTSGTAPLDVDFSAEGSDPEGSDLAYAWDFGVAGTQDDSADTADASWTYTEPGTYTATVTVTDDEGLTAEDSVEVVVDEESPGGDVFVVDAVDTATNNQWVSEDNGTSTVTIEVGDTVEWQFDQATMGHDLTSLDTADTWDPKLQEYRGPNGDPIRYTFTEPGTYEYWCSVHGATMRGTVVVEEPAEANRPPTAEPFVSPRTGPAPLYAHFEARASDPDGDTLTYLWDFGQSDLPSDQSTASHAHVTYADPGRYVATLTVSDGKGGTHEEEFEITVTGEAPRVTIEATPTSGPAPLPVAFEISAIDDQGGPLSYTWDWGDGTTYTGPKPPLNHVYTAAGSYTATLTVTDPDGNEGSDSVDISVDALPEIQAEASPATGDAPLDVDFSTRVTTGGELTAFADGTATYPDLSGSASMVRSRGETVTTLEVTGLKPDAAHQVHVHEQSCADGNGGAHFRFDTDLPFSEDNEIWLPFTSDADGTSGEVVVTSDQRAGAKAVAIVIHDPDNPAKRIGCVDLDPSTAGLTYAWDFGDGESADVADPTHTYAEPGTYEATVTVSREGGTDEVTDTVEVVVTGDEPVDPAPSTLTATATPPEVIVGQGTTVAVEVSSQGATPTGQVTLRGGGTTYGPRTLDGGRASFPVGPFTDAGSVTFTASYDGTSDVAASEGTVTVTVKAAPVPGDTTAPDTTIGRGPTGSVKAPAATFTFASSEAGSSFQCSLDGGAWASCASPATFSKLAQGEHELRVRAVDRAGNTDASPAVRTWTVDRGKPTVKPVGPNRPTTDRTPTVKVRVTDEHHRVRAGDVTVRVGGKKAAKVRVTRKGLLVATSKALSPGRHRVVVKVRDEAGNVRTVRWWIRVVR